MRFLCSCTPLSGHVLPMLPLAAELQRSGHEVVFATGDDVRADVAAAGLRHVTAGPTFDELLGIAFERFPDTPFDEPADFQRFGWGRLFSEVRVGASVDALRSVASDLRPDAIIHDVADLVGPLVAAEMDVPSANVGIGLVPEEWQVALAAEAVAPWWDAVGLTPPDAAGMYRSLYLNQFPRSMQRPTLSGMPAVADLRPVSQGDGEALPSDLERLGTERRLVYVTLGTVFGDAELLQRILDAVSVLDVDVLVTVGRSLDPTVVVPHPRVTARPFVPQGAVLDRCAAVVCHGGVGSALGPLAAGIPLVVVPLGADQFENATAFERAGVARSVRAEVVTELPDELTGAVSTVLANDSVRHAVEGIRTEIAAMPSPAQVAGRLADLFGA